MDSVQFYKINLLLCILPSALYAMERDMIAIDADEEHYAEYMLRQRRERSEKVHLGVYYAGIAYCTGLLCLDIYHQHTLHAYHEEYEQTCPAEDQAIFNARVAGFWLVIASLVFNRP